MSASRCLLRTLFASGTVLMVTASYHQFSVSCAGGAWAFFRADVSAGK